MNTRIKTLRKKLGLTQPEFASKLNLSGNYVFLIEKGERNPSDRTISDICRIFDVNEEWLRTGEGEMFNPEPTDKLEEIAISHGLSPQYAAIFRSLLSLPPEKQDTIVQFVLDTADAMRAVEKESAEEKKKNG